MPLARGLPAANFSKVLPEPDSEFSVTGPRPRLGRQFDSVRVEPEACTGRCTPKPPNTGLMYLITLGLSSRSGSC